MATGNRGQRAAVDYGRLSFMILFMVVFYNEMLVYFNSYRSWPGVENRPTQKLLKILLVADPQIQGANDMDNWLLGTITRWDSDRYLSKTFSWAKYAYAPDVIVFLGDLIDEGSEAESEAEYQGYVKRFKGIYDNSDAIKVYVAGDNDIGGEGSDPLTPEKVDRFRKNFPSHPNFLFQVAPDKIIQRYELEENEKNPVVEIIPANVLTFKSADQQWFTLSSEPDPSVKIRIVVSHIPISLPNSSPSFSKEVMKHLQPSVIFSAHDHRGLDYAVSKDSKDKPLGNVTIFTQKGSADDDDENIIKIHVKDKQIHEIIVPTCSYRMGVKEMALGLATVTFDQDDAAEITYHNLWLPSRFPLLFVYLAALSMSGTLFLIGRVKRRTRRSSMSGSGSSTPKRRRGSLGSKSNAHYSKLV